MYNVQYIYIYIHYICIIDRQILSFNVVFAFRYISTVISTLYV